MQEENTSFPFYQKTQNLREMHKNRQNSVDSISNICLHVGMDAREMKKMIQLKALELYEVMMEDREFAASTSFELELSDILDRDNPTQAQLRRFKKVLRDMIDNAESKI
jgi:hypothetical protein